ncbi:MAG: hypothetical protein H0W09_07795 [Solirubrobacterales bacterium]|nr:hypothetical protein [Solirubrobacterales bacterium]
MDYFDDLPDTRTSLRGTSPEGDEVWLIRSISQKLYTCPGCRGRVEVGAEHVVVQTIGRAGGTRHAHWHRGCSDGVLLGLRGVRRVPAGESRRDRLEARGRRPVGRRDRRRPR